MLEILKLLGTDQKKIEALIQRGTTFFQLTSDFLKSSRLALEKINEKCDIILKRVVKDEINEVSNRGRGT
ncbi:MAG: hypothetical protein ABDH59_09585 [Fervidobacterium sp.]